MCRNWQQEEATVLECSVGTCWYQHMQCTLMKVGYTTLSMIVITSPQKKYSYQILQWYNVCYSWSNLKEQNPLQELLCSHCTFWVLNSPFVAPLMNSVVGGYRPIMSMVAFGSDIRTASITLCGKALQYTVRIDSAWPIQALSTSEHQIAVTQGYRWNRWSKTGACHLKPPDACRPMFHEISLC